MPMSGAQVGIAKEASRATAIGKMITAVLDTGLSCGISMARSFFVVNSRMMGGWMTGTSDM